MNVIHLKTLLMKAEYKENFKKKIINTTNALLKKGKPVTIRSIAREIDCAVGSIYTYFPDKKMILKEVYAQSCRDFLKELQKAPHPHPYLEEDFINLMLLAYDFRVKNAYRYLQIFDNLKGDIPEELSLIGALIKDRLDELNLPALLTPEAKTKADKTLLALCEGVANIALLQNNKPQFSSHAILCFSLRSLIAGWKI